MCLDFRECGSKMNKVEDSHQPRDQSKDDHGDYLGHQEGVHNAKTGGEGCRGLLATGHMSSYLSGLLLLSIWR